MRLAACALVAALTAASSVHAADPVIHVRARLRVDVDTIERVAGGLLVRGSLRDDATDEPVPGRTVAISVVSLRSAPPAAPDGPSEGDHGFFHYAEPSDPDGAFHWRVPLPLGTYRLHIGAGGDADHAAPVPIDRTLDVARRTPTITVQVPARLPARAQSLHVVVEAHESDGIGPPRAYEGRAWLSVAGRRRTALALEDGRAESDEPGPLGHAGQRIEVTAAILDDDLRNGARGSRTVLLTTPTTVSLAVDADRVAPDALLHVSGTLRDDDGPLAGADVVVGLANGADLATFTTDARGAFAGRLRGRDLPTGTAFVEARHQPRQEFREASASPTVAVQVLPAPPVAAWPYVVSPALTLLVAAAAWAARDRRWWRWRGRRRARQVAAAAPTASGLTESRPSILATLRGRADHGITGVVVDAADDQPIATATLVARTANRESRALVVDEHGCFALEELPPGPLVVEIAAPGYVGERFTRTLPHRGELRDARVRLVPVRARIFDAWRRAAAPLYPTARAAETMTPRELSAHIERRRLLPHEHLAALTALVETSVWGARAPSTDDLAHVEELAASLKSES